MTHKKTDEGYPIFRSYLETEKDEPYYSMQTLSFYYEDMERKQELIETLAKKIVGYDLTLTDNLETIQREVEQRLGAWDNQVEQLPETVNDLLTDWVTDGTIDTIIEDARLNLKADKAEVGEALDLVQQQLAEKDLLIEEISPKGFRNADTPLYIPTYDGGDQLVHPKVLYFENGFGGHQYWMAATPYPDTNDFYENPCIYYSDDMIHWTSIPGNPIAKVETTSEHQADTDLVFVNGKLELRWLYRNKTVGNQIFYCSKSSDGLTWSAKEKFYETSHYLMASPVVLHKNNLYTLYFINPVYKLEVFTSPTGLFGSWQALGVFDIGFATETGRSPWHMDIVETDLGYEMVFCAFKTGQSHATNRLYYARSDDGLNFNNAEVILDKSHKGFDNATIYRASFIKVNGMYYMFYSASDTSFRWRIGVNYGMSLKATRGLPFRQEIPFIAGVPTVENNPGSKNKITYKSDGSVTVNFTQRSKSLQAVDLPTPGDILIKLPKFFRPLEQITFPAGIQKLVADTSFVGGWGLIGWDGSGVVVKVYGDGSKYYKAAGAFDYPII